MRSSRGGQQRADGPRPLYFQRGSTIVGGIIVALASVVPLEAGLRMLVDEEAAAQLLTGVVYAGIGLLGLASASFALWARGYSLALLGPTVLCVVSVWDIATRGTFYTSADLPALMGLVAAFSAGGCIAAGSQVFATTSLPCWRPRIVAHGPPSEGNPGAMGTWLVGPVRLVGGGLAMALAVGALLHGLSLERSGGLDDRSYGYLVAGCVGAFGAALALWGRLYPVPLVGEVTMVLCGALDLRSFEGASVSAAAPGALLMRAATVAFVLTAFSWPSFVVGEEVASATKPARPATREPRPKRRGVSLTTMGTDSLARAALVEDLDAPPPLVHVPPAGPPPGQPVVVRPSVPADQPLVVRPPSTPERPTVVQHVARPETVVEAPAQFRTPVRGPPGHIVEEVFVVHRDGRLIADCARGGRATRDADLMSGMLIAVQGLIQDGLERGGQLRSISFGEGALLLASGSHVVVAAQVVGQPDERLREELATLARRVEGAYAGVVECWTGDTAQLQGVSRMVAPLVERTAHIRPEVLRSASKPRAVVLLSAVDFHQGYVRLRAAVENGTSELIADTSLEVEYDSTLLRLERVEPAGVRLRGDRAVLGNVMPGERKTVAFLFDPQICQETHIDGSLTYHNARGVRQRLEMKRRRAEVVCPVFFTRENANTAMLKRLVKERLHLTDLRVFRYPAPLAPTEVLRLAKLAMGLSGVQLVREYVEDGPPYRAEVWYFGETKVRGQPMVMRVRVVEQRHGLEFYAASTAMEPVTGVLAEFRRSLERYYRAAHGDAGAMELDRDGALREELGRVPLLLERSEA